MAGLLEKAFALRSCSSPLAAADPFLKQLHRGSSRHGRFITIRCAANSVEVDAPATASVSDTGSSAVRLDAAAVSEKAGQRLAESQVPGKSLGIPEASEWRAASFPKSAEEFLKAVRSPAFQEVFSSPVGAASAAYGIVRTGYFVTQALYTARTINFRPAAGVLKGGVPANPADILKLVERMSPTLGSIAELYRRDAENIRRGYYKRPLDMDPRHRQWNPQYIREGLNIFVKFSNDTLARRNREGRTETREQSEEARRNPALYPEYYLQNFHFQDGWLSEFSAKAYDIATETFFLGSQDAMQRGGLIPLHFFMKGRSEKSTRLLDLACGTGRYLTFIRDNYPHMPLVGVDLSPFYLENARENMAYFTDFDKQVNGDRRVACTEFIQAAAENVPLESSSLDVISCVYLFHELPPDARTNVVKEMHRLLKPGGIVIFNDSMQRIDRPEYNFSLFPENYHEPYFLSYVDTDLPALFGAAGFILESSAIVHVSKVLCFRKA